MDGKTAYLAHKNFCFMEKKREKTNSNSTTALTKTIREFQIKSAISGNNEQIGNRVIRLFDWLTPDNPLMKKYPGILEKCPPYKSTKIENYDIEPDSCRPRPGLRGRATHQSVRMREIWWDRIPRRMR